jgi:hypothetical protein
MLISCESLAMPFDHNGNYTEFPIERQLMTNWCWAACTQSVCEYYGTNQGITQKRLVAIALKLPICNTPRYFPACNKTYDFGTSLDYVGHLDGDPVESSLAEDNVSAAVRHGVIGCQMEIPRIGGHAVLIISARRDSTGTLFLHIADPSDASILTMRYQQFRNDFRGTGGRWIRTYFIKA